MPDTIPIILTVIIAGTVAFLGLSIFDTTATITDASQSELRQETIPLDGTTWKAVGPQFGTGVSETVYDSRGNSIQFTGADDSYLTSDSAIAALDNETWTVMQGVWINNTATGENMTVLAVGDPELILEYHGNRSTPQWSAFYYNTPNSYRVNISAPDPTNATVIWITRNESNLTIHRDNTTGASTNISVTNTAGGNLTANSNCHCRLDETRVNNAHLNSSERGRLVDNPVAAGRPSHNRLARILYDTTSPGLYWSSATLTVSNASIAPGFTGHVMDPDTGLLDSGDYEWNSKDPSLRPTAGARLEHAPVAFVDYTFTSAGGDWSQSLQSMMDSFAQVFVVIGAVLILGYLMLLNTSR